MGQRSRLQSVSRRHGATLVLDFVDLVIPRLHDRSASPLAWPSGTPRRRLWTSTVAHTDRAGDRSSAVSAAHQRDERRDAGVGMRYRFTFDALALSHVE